MAVQIQIRRGTAAAWTSANPTLAAGEFAIETDTDYYKIGDGSTAWTSLGYSSLPSGSATLASPTFTGVPAAPTAAANTSTTQIATTAFVMTEVGDYAPLASPTLTGTPAAPTASANTSTTQIATTAFVMTEIGDYAPLASPTFTGTVTVPDLTVNGTTTTINSTTLTVDDKNLELGSVATPSDTTADGGGITLKGASDKTILWTNSTDTWDFNQGITVTGTATATAFTLDSAPATAWTDTNIVLAGQVFSG